MAGILDPVRPLSIERIETVISLADLQYSKAEGQMLVMAFPSGVISASLTGPADALTLEVAGRWRGEGEASHGDKVAAFCAAQNLERLSPKVLLLTDASPAGERVSVGTSVVRYCPLGLSDAQLRNCLTNAIRHTLELFKLAAQDLPELVTWDAEEAQS